MKLIKVRYWGTTPFGDIKKGKPFWVKEKNPYFEWYKKSKHYKVLEEREIGD